MDQLDDDGVEPRREDAPPGLFLSRRGAWYHDGDRLRHLGLESLLWKSIARASDGGLIVTTGRDRLPFLAEDAPFVVRTLGRAATGRDDAGRTGAASDAGDAEDRGEVDDIALVLADGSEEAVARRSFFIDDDGRVRCPVKGGRFWALLSRSATQLLLELVDDEGRIVTPAGPCALTPAPAWRWSDPPHTAAGGAPRVSPGP